MSDEKDLRGITKGGKDLLQCLNKQESIDYHREEGKGKYTYRKGKIYYKLTTEPNGCVRKWTQKEICMYEQLKKYNTLTEIVLMLLKLETSISAVTAQELLKDHPMKPGARGIAQAISRVYQKLEPILEKYQHGRQVFYQFKSHEYKQVDLKNLMAVYLRKKSIESITKMKYSISNVPDSKTLLEYVQEFEPRIKNLEACIEGFKSRLDAMEELGQLFLNKVEPGGQRIDVHHHLHIGKED